MPQIIVNGLEFDCKVEHASYEDIVLLAGMPEAKNLTMTYRCDHGDICRSGTLVPGRSIDVEDGMVFDAVYTGNA